MLKASSSMDWELDVRIAISCTMACATVRNHENTSHVVVAEL